jgi:hypothetical protein
VFAAHPYLEGVDGIALDRAGSIHAAANERNAIVVVTPSGAWWSSSATRSGPASCATRARWSSPPARS